MSRKLDVKPLKCLTRFLVLITVGLSGCQRSSEPAPIEVGHGIPGGNPYTLDLDSTLSLSPTSTASSQGKKGQSSSETPKLTSFDRPDFIIVQEGQTLYSIASQYKMSGAEIITLNNLQAPYKLEVEQKVFLKSQKQPSFKADSLSLDQQFIRPVQGRVIGEYGHNGNEGINIAAPQNTPVFAAQKGKVTYVGGDLEDFGNMVLITHENDWQSAYAHLNRATVQQGEFVTTGQAIGYVGQTGTVNSPQLHFELRQGTKSVNPHKYIK